MSICVNWDLKKFLQLQYTHDMLEEMQQHKLVLLKIKATLMVFMKLSSYE